MDAVLLDAAKVVLHIDVHPLLAVGRKAVLALVYVAVECVAELAVARPLVGHVTARSTDVEHRGNRATQRVAYNRRIGFAN